MKRRTMKKRESRKLAYVHKCVRRMKDNPPIYAAFVAGVRELHVIVGALFSSMNVTVSNVPITIDQVA